MSVTMNIFQPEPEDCPNLRPYQLMYAYVGFECVNTGIVWQHITTTPERDNWEKPDPTGVKFILNVSTFLDFYRETRLILLEWCPMHAHHPC